MNVRHAKRCLDGRCAASARRRDIAMVAFVFVLLLSYIWVWQGSFRGATAVFTFVLLGALLLDLVQHGKSLQEVGFRIDTLGTAALLLAPPVAIVIVLTVFLGNVLGSARLPTGSAAAEITKLIAFGLMQQYVLLGFFLSTFERLLPTSASSVVTTAVVFAIFHLPNPFLTTVTFLAGLLAAIVYRRAPNLWANGVAHGLISFCLYYSLPSDITAGLRVGPGYWAR